MKQSSISDYSPNTSRQVRDEAIRAKAAANKPPSPSLGMTQHFANLHEELSEIMTKFREERELAAARYAEVNQTLTAIQTSTSENSMETAQVGTNTIEAINTVSQKVTTEVEQPLGVIRETQTLVNESFTTMARNWKY